MTAVQWMVNELNNQKCWADPARIEIIVQQALELEKQKFEDYASFAIYCDRQNLPILKHDEFFKL